MGSQEDLVSKISNMYIMVLYAISKGNMERAKHYLSDDLYHKFEQKVNNDLSRGILQKYGELNVASVRIDKNDGENISATIEAKYIDYRVDKDTKKFIDGETTRSSHNTILTIKRNVANDEKIIYHCPGCGGGLDINLTSVCPHCGRPLNNSENEYVIENIEILD